MAKVTKESIDRFYDYSIHPETRTIYIGSLEVSDEGESGVDAKLAEQVIKALHILDQKDEPITIILNSFGGDYAHGLAIYDAIKNCQSEITIKVFGAAMSMGAVILQAADTRIMSPNSRCMIHYGDSVLEGHAKNVQAWAKEDDRLNTLMEDILLEKIKEKHPTFKREQLQKMLDPDTILNAIETVNLGLADEVL